MKLEQWRAGIITLEAEKDVGNPFLDREVTAVFTAPDGSTLKLLAYWDGGRTYRIRFAPTMTGVWTWSAASSDGDAGLAGSGSVDCVPYTGDLDIYRHGFLKKGPQGRYLAHADNTPFFWLGDTHWTFVTEERWDESNCPKYESQFKAVVDRRADQGFNVYQCNFRDGKDYHAFGRYFEYLLETDRGYLPNLDLLQGNVDLKMQYLADKGFVIAVGYSWGGAILQADDRVERYLLLAKYLVARYGAYPVIWTIGGEIPGYSPEEAPLMAERWEKVAIETRAADGYHSLITVHGATDEPRSATFAGRDWYDFGLIQSGHGDFRVDNDAYENYVAAHPALPLVEGESLYDGIQSGEAYGPRTITPMIVRRPAWLCIQSGGCGYTYGCNGIWEMQWEADTGMWGEIWGSCAWYDGLELPAAASMTIMRRFYESVGWSRLRPIPQLLTVHNAWGNMEVPAVFSNEELRMRSTPSFTADPDMTTIVGYYKPTVRCRIGISTLTERSYTARWFDPSTGEYTLIDADVRPAAGRWMAPPKPTADDWVLLLQANR